MKKNKNKWLIQDDTFTSPDTVQMKCEDWEVEEMSKRLEKIGYKLDKKTKVATKLKDF